jgi:hypothetical protein
MLDSQKRWSGVDLQSRRRTVVEEEAGRAARKRAGQKARTTRVRRAIGDLLSINDMYFSLFTLYK